MGKPTALPTTKIAKRQGKLQLKDDVVIAQLYKKGYNERRIAHYIGVSRNSIRVRLIAMGYLKSNFNPETVTKVLGMIDQQVPYDQIANRLNVNYSTVAQIKYLANKEHALQPIEQSHIKIIGERRNIATRWKPGRYVVGSDAHIRFHSQRCLDSILSLKGDYDGFIMSGDLIDSYWLSSFRKGGYISFASEIEVATDIMMMLAKRFGRVLYFHGNHEERLWKQLLVISEPLSNLAGEAGAQVVVKALTDIRDWYFGGISSITVHYGWFVEIGKVLISHADLYSSMQGRTASNILEHYMNHTKDWQLGDISAVMEGHLHRHDGPKRKWGRYLWELPCMTGPLDYQMASRANRGQCDTGYSILTHNKDGTLNFNESRSFLIDP